MKELKEVNVKQDQISIENIRKIILEILQKELNRRLALEHFTKAKDIKKKEDNYNDALNGAGNDSDDDMMDIDLTSMEEEIKDLATVEGKINGHEVSVILDSASNKDLMPRIIADKLELQRNTNVSYNIRGVTGKDKFTESTDATIFLGPECKIKTTFVIADDYPVPEVILGRSTLRKYNYDLFESKEHASITCNGKNFFIPIVPDINRQKKTKEQKKIEE